MKPQEDVDKEDIKDEPGEGDYIDEDTSGSEEEEDEEDRIERELQEAAQHDAIKFDVNRVFDSLGMKRFPECIVAREEWGAVPPTSPGVTLDHPVPNVVFTYTTGVDSCETQEACVKAVQDLQKRHMTDGGMSDIGFNFIVGGDLRVYEGRGWNIQPDQNFQFPELQGKRLDVGFIGNFTPASEKMPLEMAGMAIELAHHGVGVDYILKEYRLVESEMLLSPDVYEAGKEEYRPDLQLRFETYWPGQVIREELPWENPEDQVPPEEYVDDDD